MNSIFLLILLYGLVRIGDATHFLGGTITWRLLNESATGTPVAIIITQTYSYTYTLVTCTNAQIATNQLIPNGAYPRLLTGTLDCITNCASGAIGYVAPSIRPQCADISPSVDITVGQRSDTVFLHAGDDFAVAYQDYAWRALASAASANWSISSRINLTPRSDNGLYNNAPVATLMSPINIPYNQSIAIHIPVVDADGDTTRCRWSTLSNGVDECGGACPPSSLPPNTVIYPNCTIIIIGQTIGSWFAITLMVEDFISPNSTTPLSSVPVQFLIQVVNVPKCTIPPEVVGIPVEQACIPMTVGQTFNSQLIAINNCGSNVTIVDIATLSFAGMVKGTIVKLNTTTYYKTLSWTPTAAQLGFQVMCAMALDSENSQSAQYCFQFYVSEDSVCTCPGYICTTTTTTTTTSTATSTTSTSATSTSTTSTSTASTTSTTTTTTASLTTTTSTTTTTITTVTTTTSTTTSTANSTTTTSVVTTSIVTTVSSDQSIRSLALGLGLGLGIPLLLLLGTLALCLCCPCCPAFFCKICRRRFWSRKEDSDEQYQSQYDYNSAINNIEMSDVFMKDYRRQYINENSWSPTRISGEGSFLYSSQPPSEFCSSIATRTTLMSSLSNNVLPSVGVSVITTDPPQSSHLISSGSILVRAYIDQETRANTFGH